MTRYLVMLSLFASVPAAAQDLTVSASFTFMVTSPNPQTAIEYNSGSAAAHVARVRPRRRGASLRSGPSTRALAPRLAPTGAR